MDFENQEHGCSSDCEIESSTEETEHQKDHILATGFCRLQTSEPVYKAIAEKFISQLSSCGYDAQIEVIYRNNFSTALSEARRNSFNLYSKAFESELGGSSNMVYAWYGASMAEISDILDHGFCFPSKNCGYGNDIHLSPSEKPLNSFLSATPDENGLRRMLLCKVILGKSEVIPPGSLQNKPSSREFDSGVDSLSSPTTYAIWSSRMNTHILPEVMVMFKASRTIDCNGRSRKRGQRISELMPFRTLVRSLSRFLPCDAVEMITKAHVEYTKKKMSKMEMIERVRSIAGDRLLLEIVKSYRGKATLLRCF